MGAPEARIEALVLKKTKLGEADLILHLMALDGSSVRAVAKGARKPRNASSATLDLFNRVQVTIITGRELGIAKDSRLIAHRKGLQADPVRFACASAIAEAADAAIHPGLPAERLFAMTDAALEAAEVADEGALPLILAAHGFKLTALLGMRPSFSACAICGGVVNLAGRVRFSHGDGGSLCAACAAEASTTGAPAGALALSDALLRSTFADLAHRAGEERAWDALALAEEWIGCQMGIRLRSLSAFKSICGCFQAQAVV